MTLRNAGMYTESPLPVMHVYIHCMYVMVRSAQVCVANDNKTASGVHIYVRMSGVIMFAVKPLEFI